MRTPVVSLLVSLLVALLVSLPLISTLPAQTPYPVTLAVDSRAVASTFCHSGGVIVSFVNAAVLGTDSAAEILAHEAVHRRQMERHVATSGGCPAMAGEALLVYELEAYCASDSLRAVRVDTAAVSRVTMLRLLTQFGVENYVRLREAWRVACPAFGVLGPRWWDVR